MKTSPGFLMSTYNYDGYGLTDSGTSDPYVYHIGQMPTGPGGQPYLDGMQAMLGGNWNNLRPGDIVTVKITHIPSGKVIFSKDVTVTGA